MKTIIFLAAILALASSKGIVFPIEWPWAPFDPLDTADNLVLENFVGKWFEIALIPFYWEENCFCTYANYSINSDGTINVANSCRVGSTRSSTNFTTMTGTAWVTGKAQLQVEFFYPFDARYWVLKVDDAHSYAMIGEPSRNYLWILSRSPALSTTIYNDLVAYAQANGFPTEKLTKTTQACY